jgi:hypothetical protein
LVNDANSNNNISENIIVNDKRQNSFIMNNYNSVSNKNRNSSSINEINTNNKPMMAEIRKFDEKLLNSINIINCTLGGISTNRKNNNEMKINFEDTKSEKLIRKKGRMSLNYFNSNLGIIPITFRKNYNLQKKELNFNKKYPKSPAQYIKINFNKNNPEKNMKNNFIKNEKYLNKVNKIFLTKKYNPSQSLININKNNSISQKIVNTNIYLNVNRNSSNNLNNKEIKNIPMTKIKCIKRPFYKRINNSTKNNNFILNTNSDISSYQESKNPNKMKYYQLNNNIIPINYKNYNNIKYIFNHRYNSPIFKNSKKKIITCLRMNRTRSPIFQTSFN